MQRTLQLLAESFHKVLCPVPTLYHPVLLCTASHPPCTAPVLPLAGGAAGSEAVPPGVPGPRPG
jgi:hypothetical protein